MQYDPKSGQTLNMWYWKMPNYFYPHLLADVSMKHFLPVNWLLQNDLYNSSINILILAFAAHGIIPQEGTTAKIYDWNRTAVGDEVFPILVQQFSTNKDFFLELDIINLEIRTKCQFVNECLVSKLKIISYLLKI